MVTENWINLNPMNIRTTLETFLLKKRMRPFTKQTKLKKMVTANWINLNPMNIRTRPETFLLKRRMRPKMKETKLKRMVTENWKKLNPMNIKTKLGNFHQTIKLMQLLATVSPPKVNTLWTEVDGNHSVQSVKETVLSEWKMMPTAQIRIHTSLSLLQLSKIFKNQIRSAWLPRTVNLLMTLLNSDFTYKIYWL